MWFEKGTNLLNMFCWDSARFFSPSAFYFLLFFLSFRVSVCQPFNHPTVYHCQELEGVEVFGAVEGGDILEERVRSARETAKRPVAGFCLDGLQTGAMNQALRTQLITAMTKELPEDKPRSALLVAV